MEDLRYQSWSLGRQLNALYRTLEQICGVAINRDDVGPGGDDPAEQQMTLEGLRRQDAILRQQIRDLVAKLPIRQPHQVTQRKRKEKTDMTTR